MWQEAHKKMKAELAKNKQAAMAVGMHPSVSIDTRSNETSMILENKRTEPLITKAYNAFRQSSQSNVGDAEKLLATEAYIDQ